MKNNQDKKCACGETGHKDHCLACQVTGKCLCGVPKHVEISSSSNSLSPISSPSVEEWSFEFRRLPGYDVNALLRDNVEQFIREILSRVRSETLGEAEQKLISSWDAACDSNPQLKWDIGDALSVINNLKNK